MVQCEMCGAETSSPNTVKVEGAELDVCDDCADFGTEVRQQSSSSTSTKYSTGSSGSAESSSSSGSSSGGSSGTRSGGGGSSGGSSGRSHDMFDEMDEVAQDYDQRIRQAREAAGLSQEELAKQLNEKASLIRKLELGDTLPSDTVQSKLERALEISLTESGDGGDTEWESGSSEGEYTLGDMVERKDS